ncbi:hypothetical protein AB8B12_00555 [Streptomyces sp. PGLac3x]
MDASAGGDTTEPPEERGKVREFIATVLGVAIGYIVCKVAGL